MTCRLEAIFQRQAEFVASLYPIYKKNGFEWHATSMPWPLNNRECQEEFRLLAWRMTEEIIEAVQLHYECTGPLDDFHAKFREEVSDVLHFFVELCLATGVKIDTLTEEFAYDSSSPDCLEAAFHFCGPRRDQTIPESWHFVIYKLGIAMHELRQRPWRTDDRRTDPNRFDAAMTATFITFISACKRSEINADSLYEAYFAKGKINDRRTADQKL